MERVARWWKNIAGYKVDPDSLIAYRSVIPSRIDVVIKREGDHYVAVVKSIENEQLPSDVFLITEADSDKKLVGMVNDLVLSYKGVPELYRPYFKATIPLQQVAREPRC